MLIEALCDYYNILEKKGKVTPDGYTKVKLDFMICLTLEGDIDEILDIREKIGLKDKNGKIKVQYNSRVELLPERSQKPGIDLNIIEHRPVYIFGLNFVNDAFTPFDNTNKAMKSHDIFVDGNIKFIEGIDVPLVNAYRNFLIRWKPEEQTNNSHLLRLGKDYGKSYYAFCLSGKINEPLHHITNIRNRWDSYYADKLSHYSEFNNQCAVTGKVLPIARIHNKIQGVKGGQAAGGVLVSYKNDAESSYNKGQSFNSNISEIAMKKYTESLNILLSEKSHKTILDDMTVIHWSQTVNNKKVDDFINWMAFDDKLNDDDMNSELRSIFDHLKSGVEADYNSINLDENIDYYIAGITPNNSRLSLKFIYREKIGKVISNVMQHQKDLKTEGIENQIPLWKITKELISPKSKNETVPPPLITGIFKSIIFGTNYPEQLLSTVVKRVKTDSDTEDFEFVKVNLIRVGIIKACINRKSRLFKNEEVIKVALDTKSTNPAYLCGRLFAILEKIQEKASNSKLNKTIKDSYFSSACSTPAAVFPRLLMLAQNHLKKIESEKFWSSSIGDIMNLMGREFPQTLSLTDQGMFIIGYYQQYYNKKEKSENMEVEEDGSN